MNIDDKNAPICNCHNLNKIWRTDSRKKSGGYWICDINRQISRRKWRLKDMRQRIVIKLKEIHA